jgi:hypothetical protein
MNAIIAAMAGALDGGAPLTLTQIAVSIGAGLFVLAAILVLEGLNA